MGPSPEVSRMCRQLRSGNVDANVQSPHGFTLPDESALRLRLDGLLQPSPHLNLQIPEGIHKDVEQIFDCLYRGKDLPVRIASGIGPTAVVTADGSRPVFFPDNGHLGQIGVGNGPFVDFVEDNRETFERAMHSVGRIETDDRFRPAGTDKWYDGTAFLIADNLAMTNRHVVERMVYEPESPEGPFTFKARYWLNFAAASGESQSRFVIEEVVFVGPQAIGGGGDIARLDLAVLRIGNAERDGTERPSPLTLTTRHLTLEEKVALIGYPSSPEVYTGAGTPRANSEYENILRCLFGLQFGDKLCAPGSVEALPGFPGDTEKWTMEHDASTLSGNSGSPVLTLSGGSAFVSALHFAGLPREANYAHVFDKIAGDLSRVGIAVEP